MKKGPWPHSEDSLGKQLSQLAPLLESAGVKVERSRGSKRRWTVHSPDQASDECDGQVSEPTANQKMASNGSDTCQASDSNVIAVPSNIVHDDELEDLCKGVIS